MANGSLRINSIPVSENPVFDFFSRTPIRMRLYLKYVFAQSDG